MKIISKIILFSWSLFAGAVLLQPWYLFQIVPVEVGGIVFLVHTFYLVGFLWIIGTPFNTFADDPHSKNALFALAKLGTLASIASVVYFSIVVYRLFVL